MTIPDTRPADLSLPCEHPFAGCPCRQAGDAILKPTKANPNAQFVLGFADWALAEPDRLGEPLENERGGVPNFSQQLTSKGILTAANLTGRGWVLLFWDRDSGTRWVYRDGQSEQIA